MKIWKEYELDAFDYFEYFEDELDKRDNKILPNMSVISFNANGIVGKYDRLKFINICSSQIESLVNINNRLKEYSFYLVINKEIEDINSKVENYKKIWKDISGKWNLEGFTKGPEIKTEAEGVNYFSSIAEFNMKNLPLALEIVSMNPKLKTIIISKSKNILTEKYVDKMFHILFNSEAQNSNEIDYFNLSIQCCNEGNIAIRWGTSFEESELALIYNPKIINILM